MAKLKCYISGKITGIDNYEKLFSDAENYLLSKGYDVVNPVKLNHDHDKSWESYMRVDLKALLDCDAIYMLKNFHSSKGAIIEKNLAYQLGIKIINEK
jgi:hypothetical protein